LEEQCNDKLEVLTIWSKESEKSDSYQQMEKRQEYLQAHYYKDKKESLDKLKRTLKDKNSNGNSKDDL